MTSTTNNSANGHSPNSDNGETMTTVENGESRVEIHYRCAQCHEMFPTVEAYRRHYLVDHLGAKINEDEEGRTSDRANSNGTTDDQQTNPNRPHSTSTSSSGELPNVFSPLCKRCRTRIGSSDDEDEDVKRMRNEPIDLTKPKGTPKTNHGHFRVPVAIGASSSGDQWPIPSNNNNNKNATDQSTNPGTGLLGFSSLFSKPLGPRPKDTPQRKSEALASLLKDANTLTKFSKVIIINFFNGRRVNPNPSQGPIQVIRLGQKTETTADEDGRPQCYQREWFVRLNFDTGDWEKIQKSKRLELYSDSPPHL